jgi:hypothetical protein
MQRSSSSSARSRRTSTISTRLLQVCSRRPIVLPMPKLG